MRWPAREVVASRFRRARPTAGPELPVALEEVFRLAAGRPVVVLAGAATSLAAPAALPAVAGFWAAFSRQLSILAPDLGEPDELAAELRRPPFEQVLEQLDETLGERGSFVNDLLTAVYRSGSPNAAHTCLAGLLSSGRVHLVLTTNFDTHIEDADSAIRAISTEIEIADLLAELGPPREALRTPAAPTVVHLHGVVGGRLDAIQRQVSRPLSGARRDLLRRLALDSLIAAVGYSGSDADIGPYLAWPSRNVVYVNRTRPGARRAFVEVDLNPERTGYAGFGGEAAALFDGLRDTAALQRVIGVTDLARGRRVAAAARFAAAIRREDTTAGRLGLSRSLAAMSLLQAGAAVIGRDPEPDDPLWARAIDERAFLRRQAGHYAEAAEDCARLRRTLVATLERRAAADAAPGPEVAALVWDLERAAAHEVEASVLLASARSGSRQQIQEASRAALDVASRWLASAPTVPGWDVDFMRGELGMLLSDWRSAVRGYRAYERMGGRWLGVEGIALAEIRISAAYAALRMPRRAVSAWVRGFRASISAPSLVHAVQYGVGLPVLLGRPGYLWRARRVAARSYRVLEWLAVRALWAWGGEHRAAIAAAREASVD